MENAMNKKTLRQNRLVNIISRQGMLPIKMLAANLQVSEMTIYRDLKDLKVLPIADNDMVVSLGRSDEGVLKYSLYDALRKANHQKVKIGEYAASLIERNDIIIIDAGSTTAKMLSQIPTTLNLTVLTFNANVLFELRYRKGIRILFCGGTYHPDTEMFESPESIRFINRIRANKVFLSAAGVHKDLGITCENDYEVSTKRAIINSAMERILLVDSGKFDKVRSSYFCGLSVINTVVTDDDLGEAWRKHLQDSGITLHIV